MYFGRVLFHRVPLFPTGESPLPDTSGARFQSDSFPKQPSGGASSVAGRVMTHGSHRNDSWKEGSVLGVMRRDASQLHFSGVPTERLLPRPSTSGTLEEPCGCCLRLTIGAYFQLSFDAASPEGRGEAVGGSFYH
ncbi:hypothetical protein HPB47_025832 [Ixodes persulcatus]|uniref:Uncharacterized protein n=1 Tax=Ixodes persulcatus TaxID=34615 RepID=A0AC60Q2G0_IXOPE|nr:hypothetical protein HPB47_025832 [Ixodes persulcatus]